MDDLSHNRRLCKLHRSLMYLAYSFDMLSMGVCTTRHWQMSSQLMQELNACTVSSSKSDNKRNTKLIEKN